MKEEMDVHICQIQIRNSIQKPLNSCVMYHLISWFCFSNFFKNLPDFILLFFLVFII